MILCQCQLSFFCSDILKYYHYILLFGKSYKSVHYATSTWIKNINKTFKSILIITINIYTIYKYFILGLYKKKKSLVVHRILH
jgi:hypothetical protein